MRFKKVLSNLEPEGQGHGIIMGVSDTPTSLRAILLRSSLMGAINYETHCNCTNIQRDRTFVYESQFG